MNFPLAPLPSYDYHHLYSVFQGARESHHPRFPFLPIALFLSRSISAFSFILVSWFLFSFTFVYVALV